MRRYEIDWIRNISILMLFIYHTSAIFCQFGDFYIISEQKNIIADFFILVLFVWYMPMLFFLAGASTYFSSQRRDLKQYLTERTKKLLVPLLFGLVVIVPPQTYMARIWRGESNISYLEHLKFFFTNLTDFTGFDGAFTPAHLWFILYLFIVSILAGLLIFKILKSHRGSGFVSKVQNILNSRYNFIYLLVLGVFTDLFPSIMGKSIIGCFAIFTLGYIVYQKEELLNNLSNNRFKYLTSFFLFAITGIVYVLNFRPENMNAIAWILDAVLKNGVLISAICMVVGFSSIHLNKSNGVLKYLNKCAFPVYIIHQPVLLAIALFIIPIVKSTTIAMLIIIALSVILTFAIYTLLIRVKLFKYLLCG